MKKLLLIFVLALLLNLIWENLHSYFYAHYRDGAITSMTLLRAAVFDAVFITILGLFFMKIPYLGKNLYYVFIIGFIAAVFIEKYALQTNRWQYNELMPIIPFINVGLTPAIQLGILSYIIFSAVGIKKN